MDFKSELLTLRLTGSEIKPEKLKVSELSSLLKNYERALKGIIATNEEGKVDEAKFHISLVGVKSESAGYELAAFSPIDSPLEYKPALIELDEIISGRRAVKDINPKTFEAVNGITGFLRSHKCNAELYYDNELVTTLPKELVLGKEIAYITEHTTLYGLINDAGKEDNPRVEIKLLDGRTLNIPVTIEKASDLGKVLFKKIALDGQSKVHPITFEIIEFKLTDYIILDEEASYTDRIDRLKQLIGKSWDGIDPKTYLEDE